MGAKRDSPSRFCRSPPCQRPRHTHPAPLRPFVYPPTETAVSAALPLTDTAAVRVRGTRHRRRFCGAPGTRGQPHPLSRCLWRTAPALRSPPRQDGQVGGSPRSTNELRPPGDKAPKPPGTGCATRCRTYNARSAAGGGSTACPCGGAAKSLGLVCVFWAARPACVQRGVDFDLAPWWRRPPPSPCLECVGGKGGGGGGRLP